MRGGTRAGTIARRVGTGAVTLLAGLTFAVGCGSDKPADSTGATGTTEAAPNSTNQSTDPGATASASPGADGGGGGGTGGETPGTGGGGGGEGGGGGTGGGTPTGSNACSVLTGADATQALGVDVKNSVNNETECLYEAGGNAVMFSLTTEAYNAEEMAGVDMLPGVTRLQGIGDAALKVKTPDSNDTQYHVWIRGKYVAIVVTKESGDTEAPGRQLLDKVLTRI